MKKSRPNIILVMTDDQGHGDLGCHGHPFLKTPNLNRLYSQSVRFTDFHASPTCAPTRSALMTGRAPFKNGVTHTILERERLRLDTATIAEVLKGAGYVTGIFGKWHLGDADEYQPDRRGFDEVFIHGGGGIGQSYAGTCADTPGNGYFDPVMKHNNTFVKTDGYCADVYFQQGLAWIEENKDRPTLFHPPTKPPKITTTANPQKHQQQTQNSSKTFDVSLNSLSMQINHQSNQKTSPMTRQGV